jgi:hypothetical protein
MLGVSIKHSSVDMDTARRRNRSGRDKRQDRLGNCSIEAREMEKVTRLTIEVRISRMPLRLGKADFRE